jgi:CheY-like chemotaxis protein/anti-sigma regulatory factor (Ser/Thr protein kinase)
LLTLINDVLDMSKIEARKLELHPQALHLPSFLEGIVGIMRMAAQQKQLDFVYKPSRDLPASIEADEKRLRQVLLNLLGNAVKFTERGQVTLRVEATAQSAATLRQDSGQVCYLQFLVEDTGIGIDSDQVERIFQPFEQTGDVRQRAEGSGLGLAISQSIVELMGERIHVQSEPGRGSVFSFAAAFPVVTAATRAPGAVARQITGYLGPRRRILIVDDRPENRMVLLNLLAPLGFEVTLAEDGRAGVEQARAHTPDLIFIDLIMPVMMGFEAVPAIRQIPELSNVPIVAVSASVLELDQRQSQQVGCDDFLTKPLEAGKVFALLQRYLGIEWLYVAQPEPLEQPAAGEEQAPASELIPPPQDELEILYELARFGNMERIQQRARHLEALSPRYRPFARRIHQMAASFDDQRIQDLIQQYLVDLEHSSVASSQ